MQRRTLRPGFLLLDVLLGIAVFTLFVMAIALSMLIGQEGAVGSGDRVRAVHLTEQAVEAARAIRNAGFDDLVQGTHGFRIGSGGTWILSGTGSTSPDGFTTSLVVADGQDGRKTVTARTAWSFGQGRSGSVALTTEFWDWRQETVMGDWTNPEVEGSYVDEGTPLFNHIALHGDFAFVTSETADGGDGLYVFDIHNPLAPQRVAAGFRLGAPGYRVLAANNRLYVATGHADAEIRIYDITDPEGLSAEDLLASIDVPGNARVRSIALYGTVLFAGATHDATQDEFYAYDVADADSVTLLDSLNQEGGIADVSLHQGYAYLASTEDIGELRVVDIFDPAHLSTAQGSGYNLTDVHDGQAIAAFGTSALIGRASGEATEELVLFNIEANPVPSPPPGPWYFEAGGNVTAMDVSPGGLYAFIASDFDSKEFRVLSIPRFSLGLVPEIGTYDAQTGGGRGIRYDIHRDRAYMTTNTAFIIFRPGS